MNKNVITRAPEVHLTFWLVRWIGLFTTKSLNIVPKLKSKQITMFWHFKNVLKHKKIMIFQGRGRPQGNKDKTDLRLFPKNHDFSRSGPPAGQRGQNWPSFISKKSRFFKVGARCKCSKFDLQTEFWNSFYTILNYFDPCVSLEASELSENLKINSKSTPKLKISAVKTS